MLTHEVRRYDRARLRVLLEEAGFVIRRMTFTNFVTFPVTLAVRSLERLTGRAGSPSDADMRVPAWPINAAFDLALRAEGRLLRLADLPIGTSLLCMAEKRR